MLRINVGFLLKEGVGYSREILFEEPQLVVAEDLLVSQLHGAVTLTRTPQGLYAHGLLRATVRSECARCLVEIDQPVSSRIGELFFYPPEAAPEGAPTVGDDVHLELTPLVREDMLLSISMHALCRPDCKGLCPQCGQNWNEGPCDCTTEESDSRLSVLKKLLLDPPE